MATYKVRSWKALILISMLLNVTENLFIFPTSIVANQLQKLLSNFLVFSNIIENSSKIGELYQYLSNFFTVSNFFPRWLEISNFILLHSISPTLIPNFSTFAWTIQLRSFPFHFSNLDFEFSIFLFLPIAFTSYQLDRS